MLKLVNSAFYGFPGKINTITHAIVILGFNTVKNIVLTASVFDRLKDDAGNSYFDIEKLWMHSIGTGVIAREIASKLKSRCLEESFLAGLLHDIGKVILFKFLEDEFRQVVAHQKEHDCLLIDAEKKIIKITHSEIGGWLAQKWKLPADLRNAIKYHHNPSFAEGYEILTSIIHVSDILARAIGYGSGGDNKIPVVKKDAWGRLKLSRKILDSIYKNLDHEFENASIFLQI